MPSLSPPVTKDQIGIRTYEKPIQGEPLYETIDHHAKAGGATQGENTLAQRRASDDDGLNFFHADGKELKKRLGKGSLNSLTRSYSQDECRYFGGFS